MQPLLCSAAGLLCTVRPLGNGETRKYPDHIMLYYYMYQLRQRGLPCTLLQASNQVNYVSQWSFLMLASRGACWVALKPMKLDLMSVQPRSSKRLAAPITLQRDSTKAAA